MVNLSEQYEAHERAMQFAHRVSEMSSRFPRGHGLLADRLCCSARSIAANIAEAQRREAPPDRQHFIHVAHGAIQECAPLIEAATRSSLINHAEHADCMRELRSIANQIGGAGCERVPMEWAV